MIGWDLRRGSRGKRWCEGYSRDVEVHPPCAHEFSLVTHLHLHTLRMSKISLSSCYSDLSFVKDAWVLKRRHRIQRMSVEKVLIVGG
jgi:hypothetical protein